MVCVDICLESAFNITFACFYMKPQLMSLEYSKNANL